MVGYDHSGKIFYVHGSKLNVSIPLSTMCNNRLDQYVQRSYKTGAWVGESASDHLHSYIVPFQMYFNARFMLVIFLLRLDYIIVNNRKQS